MISLSNPIKSPASARYYCNFTKEDYYANRTETPGQFYGDGAELLEARGTVSVEPFRNLLNGFSPDGTRKLVNNAGHEDRQRGWDLTFSPDKSVSVFWAMASPEVAEQVRLGVQAAARAALDDFQDKAGFTRRGQGGHSKEKASLVFALFEHITSRALDPQLHIHAILINLSIRADGTSGTIRSHDIYLHRKAADQVFHARLAHELRTRLHLEIEQNGGAARICGVPKDLCATFSKGKQAIDAWLKERGLQGPVAAKIAALETRAKKVQVDRDDLFAYWRRVGDSHGWGPKQAEELYQNGPSKTDSRSENAQEFSWSSSWESESKAQSSRSEENRRSRKQEAHARARKQNSYRSKHHRWGDIRWKKSLGWAEARIQQKRVFPKAPSWSPASKLELPALRLVTKRSAKEIERAKANEPALLWKRQFVLGELRVRQHRLFPYAPSWSPIRKLKLPRLSYGRKTSQSPTPSQSKDSGPSKSHSHSH